MTTHPAFEAALAANDQQQLLSLYTAAISQRDRAEATIRALLNPATSTQTIAKETNVINTGRDKPDVSSDRDLHQYPINTPREPPMRRALGKAAKSTVKPKPNLADAI